MIAAALLAAALAAAPPSGTIVVFTQDGSLAAREFESVTLPRLRALAEQRGLALEIKPASAGAPADVHVTPLLVYQDAAGRSIFKGRYSDVDRFAQFLRTVRSAPLEGEPVHYDNTAVWRRGRSVVIAPIKVTSLTGTLPPRYDENAFLDRARRAVLAGFTRFHYTARVDAGPSDRAFYMDFHPYRDPSGKLFVSTAIYSVFNCVEPVYQRFDEPLSGDYNSFEDVFRDAGKMLEDEVAQLVVGSRVGDAFDPVGEKVPKPTWEGLGLALPKAAAEADGAVARRVALGTKWTIEDAAPEDPPRLGFRFAPPLDTYNGEVRVVSGTITLGKGGTLAGATGTLIATTGSVTMGNKTLDAEVKDKMLKIVEFPSATFTLDPLPPSTAPMKFGAPVPFTGTGRFEMLGNAVPLTVNAQVEPVIAEDGTPRLEVHATFRLRIADPFGLKGPDGPSPANDTMLFDARLRLRGQ
ncbi:MAG TPA: YceI family protein [Candidatus Polarisedimenticolaceae bacterium]|nr:YceI family protein [Candidatus Polarisedimenticolaceae bacterium]